MSRITNTARNAHTKRFIQDVFAQRLLDTGFRCPDDKLLCWYRIVNREIINSICFYTPWGHLPVMLGIGYGIHPLFTLPARIPSVYAPNRPLDQETFHHQPLVPTPDAIQCSMRMYHPGTQVYAPAGGDGIYTLDGVLLPLMDSAQTIEDCYRIHKRNYLDQTLVPAERKFGAASVTFMDEAIFCGDTEIFSCFATVVEQRIRFLENECREHSTDKSLQTMLQHVQRQKQALFEGERAEYLTYLQQLRKFNITQLPKKYGITI